MTSRYQLCCISGADQSALEALYRAVYGGAWQVKTRLEWYCGHPLAQAGSAIAVQGNGIVAAQPYCDFPLHTPWGPKHATLFLDVATHPAHRRRGLFRGVVLAAREAAFKRGASIIMTTPNHTAFQGFESMQEWVRLCSLDCLFLPLGVGDRGRSDSLMALGAHMVCATMSLFWTGRSTQSDWSVQSPYAIKSPWSPDTDADELWQCAADQAAIMIKRDRAFLRWRFGPDYRLFLAYDAQGPAAYAAACVITRAGFRIGMIVDCLTATDYKYATSLFKSTLAWLRAQGACAAIGYFLPHSAPWRQARAAGFRRLLRPFVPRDYPVCVSVRPEDPHKAELMNPSLWHLSLADSDLA